MLLILLFVVCNRVQPRKHHMELTDVLDKRLPVYWGAIDTLPSGGGGGYDGLTSDLPFKEEVVGPLMRMIFDEVPFRGFQLRP